MSDEITAFASGNWRGAITCALAGIAAVFALVAFVLGVEVAATDNTESAVDTISTYDPKNAGEFILGVLSFIVLAVGGALQNSAGPFGLETEFRATPLLATLACFGTMYLVFVRHGHQNGPWSTRKALFEGGRTTLVFLALIFVISIFDYSEIDGVVVRPALAPTLGWAFLLTVVTMSVGVVAVSPLAQDYSVERVFSWMRGPVRRLLVLALHQLALATVLTGIAAFEVGTSAAERIVVFADTVVFLPNNAVLVTAIAMGAPVQANDGTNTSIFVLAQDSSMWVVVPLLLLEALLVTVHPLIRDSATVVEARNAVAVYVGGFALALLFLAALVRDVALPLGGGIARPAAAAAFGLALLWGTGAALISWTFTVQGLGHHEVGPGSATNHGRHSSRHRPPAGPPSSPWAGVRSADGTMPPPPTVPLPLPPEQYPPTAPPPDNRPETRPGAPGWGGPGSPGWGGGRVWWDPPREAPRPPGPVPPTPPTPPMWPPDVTD